MQIMVVRVSQQSTYVMKLNSKLQTVMANSTMDAEVYAATLTIKEIIYLSIRIPATDPFYTTNTDYQAGASSGYAPVLYLKRDGQQTRGLNDRDNGMCVSSLCNQH
jgi:hypothetical protein